MKRVTLIFLGLTLFGSACKKDKRDTLPPVTETGANTFGCLVNGWVFIAKGAKTDWYTPVFCTYRSPVSDFSLEAFNKPAGNYMSFSYSGTIHEGMVIPFSGKNGGQVFASYGSLAANVRDKASYSSYDYCAGALTITRLYKGPCFIAGTFWFDAVNINTGDTIRIREGRFDISY